jgi:hypothetical protein
MATTTDITDDMYKQAAGPLIKLLGPISTVPKDLITSYLTLAALLGVAGGAGLGVTASYVKSKNPKLTALDRKKKFYDSKVREMANENWLNDVMATRRKLESSKLSDEERTTLEDKYIDLINTKS